MTAPARDGTEGATLPLGVVLAGGAGTRVGGHKATLRLAGRPLLAWPVAALRAALGTVAVVVREDTELPAEVDAEVWTETGDAARHPVRGLVHALERADGRDVLVLAVDLPCVRPETVRALATVAPAGPALAVDGEGRPQPLLARYPASVLPALRAAPANAPLTRTALALDPVLVEVPNRDLVNVNTPDDARRAERELNRR